MRTSVVLALAALLLATQLVSSAGADPNGAPSSTSASTISGQAVVGKLLSAATGAWDGDMPISYAYQWRRCDSFGAGCSDIPSATGETYRLRAADLAKTLRVAVTATNGAGFGDAVSAATASVEAGGAYASTVLQTADLAHYWRLGESSGSTLFDSAGRADATSGNVTLGAAGALNGDADAAARFDGSTSVASAPIDLSGTDKATVEFWLKWTHFANDDDFAMELTSNFNSNDGGFLVDPNAPEGGGKFAVSIGRSSSRNSIGFVRPSAGAWHHYAFVLDTSAPAADQITPYVDGEPVAFDKLASGTGAGNFADAILHFMSRNSTSLLAAGDLDELAIYTRKLGSQTVQAHYEAGRGQQLPVARFSASPRTPAAGQEVTFDASASEDPDGDIDHYEWDLDGDGAYGTTTTDPIVTHAYAGSQTVNVGLRVVDNDDATDVETHTVHVTAPLGPYATAVLGTSTLAHYWRLGESSGSTLWDSAGAADATASSVTLGAPGALTDDPDAAARFDGTTSAASAPIDLSDTDRATVEFWLNWAAYADNDDLAMEFTPDFNSVAGGFLVDPNAPQGGGKFAVSLGNGSTRNSVMFARPTAGAWHHYAFVLDTSAAADQQITPYVDGQAVSFDQLASGSGAGNFADSVLHFMSRNSASLLGNGDLDDLAIYKSKLSSQTIHDHYLTAAGNRTPTARFSVTPRTPAAGQEVTFDASASTDPDGEIDHYEWDLNGDGAYGTVTSDPTVTHTYGTARLLDVGVRVVDDQDATDTATRVVGVTAPLGPYARAVLDTSGIAHYWRLGESTGTTLWDSVGNADAVATGVTLGANGALTSDDDTAARFNGTTSLASAPVDLSGTDKATLEFWLNWDAYANDDALALEFTPDFNSAPGGFLVDPNAPQGGGKFAVAIGDTGSRNGVMFSRPSEGAWHHYAFVLDASAPAADQITPYVDGEPIAFDKFASSTGTSNFADSVLHFMSRNSSSLLGAGQLDDLALYGTTLDSDTIRAHYQISLGPPVASAPPSITGPYTVGAELTASPGTWDSVLPITYRYRWERCTDVGDDCTEVAAESSQTYVPTSADVDHTLRVVVTGSSLGGETAARSEPTPLITAESPVNVVHPTIDGSARDGYDLTASPGTWQSESEPTFAYQWQRCTGTVASCVDIPLATGHIYRPDTADVGHELRLGVTATANGNSASALSALTEAVRPTVPRNRSLPTITGVPADGQLLVAAHGTWSGTTPITYSYQWMRCDAMMMEVCDVIGGETSPSHQLAAEDIGAVVRVIVTATNGLGRRAVQSDSTDQIEADPPVVTTLPTLTGDATVGEALSATTGQWSGALPIAHSYGWERCTEDGDCTRIAGATGAHYVLGAVDLGAHVRVVISAENSSGTTQAPSQRSDEVQPDTTIVAPHLASEPTLVGDPIDGSTLTVDNGEWESADPVLFTYTWQRCDSVAGDCVPISGAADTTYRVRGADIGHRLRARVTGTNGGGHVQTATGPTATIEDAPPSELTPPTVQGMAVTWSTLHAQAGNWAGSPVQSVTYQWIRCDSSDACADVIDATAATYVPIDADVEHTLKVRVTVHTESGAASATSSATGAIIQETDAPSVALAVRGQLPNSQILSASRPTLSIDAEDEGPATDSGIGRVDIALDGDPWDSFEPDCSRPCPVSKEVSLEGLGPGQHIVTVTVTDGAGNATARDSTFAVDGYNPQVTLDGTLYHNAGATLTAGVYELAIFAADNLGTTQSGIHWVEVTVDGLRRFIADDPFDAMCDLGSCYGGRRFRFDTTEYGPGEHTVQVTAVDNVGLYDSESFVVTTLGDASPSTAMAFTLDGQIWRASEDGAQQEALTPVCAVDCPEHPAISPDGSRLAYDRDGAIEIMDNDGSHVRRVVEGGSSGPVFDSTGTRLFFTRRTAGDDDVYTIGTDGRGLRPLVDGPGAQVAADVARDGAWLAYEDDGTIRFKPLDEDEGRPVAVDLADDVQLPIANPRFSADGSKLAFAARAQGENDTEIFTLDLESQALAQLTRDDAEQSGPAWTSDGRGLTYKTAQPDGSAAVIAANPDGSDQRTLIGVAPPHQVTSVSHRPTRAPTLEISAGDYPGYQPADQYTASSIYPFSLFASDDVTGIQSVGIARRDGTRPEPVVLGCNPSCRTDISQRFSVSIADLPEGKAEFVATAENGAHIRTQRTTQIFIDRTSPPRPTDIAAELDADTSIARVSWITEDDPDLGGGAPGSGLEGVEYRIRRGEDWTVVRTTTEDVIEIPGVDDGDIIDLELRSVDGVGNKSDVTTDTLVLHGESPRAPQARNVSPASTETAVRVAAEHSPGAIAETTPTLVSGKLIAPRLAPASLDSNVLVASGTPTEAAINATYRDGFELTTLWGTMRLTPQFVDARASAARIIQNSAALFANVAPGADGILRPTTLGMQALVQIRDPRAPERYSWTVELPGDVKLEALSDGSVAILPATSSDIGRQAGMISTAPTSPAAPDDVVTAPRGAAQLNRGLAALKRAEEETTGYPVAVIGAPWARDADGRPIPTEYEIVGNTITLVVRHAEGGHRYPVLADPDLYDCNFDASPCGRYSAKRAAAYAHEFWDKFNPNYPRYDKGGGDCTNFMSQSLRAGGMKFMREYDRGDGSWWVRQYRNDFRLFPMFQPRFYWQNTQSWSLAHKLSEHLTNYALAEPAGAGADGTPIDPGLLRVGDVIFIDFYKHSLTWDHSQFVSGRNAAGELLLAQHSGPYEKTLSDVNARLRNAHGNRWKWRIARPIHTGANIGGMDT